MKKTTAALLLTLSAGYFVPAAFAGVSKLSVSPNPARFAGSTAPQIFITVTISGPSGARSGCEVTVDPGDGSAATPPRIDFGAVARTKTIQHIYQTPGTYRIRATGVRGCGGSRDVTATVLPAPVATTSMLKMKSK